jgi:hypothetical protein
VGWRSPSCRGGRERTCRSEGDAAKPRREVCFLWPAIRGKFLPTTPLIPTPSFLACEPYLLKLDFPMLCAAGAPGMADAPPLPPLPPLPPPSGPLVSSLASFLLVYLTCFVLTVSCMHIRLPCLQGIPSAGSYNQSHHADTNPVTPAGSTRMPPPANPDLHSLRRQLCEFSCSSPSRACINYAEHYL